MKKFTIPSQCQDQPYEKKKADYYMQDTEIIDLFTNIENQAKYQRQQQNYLEYSQQQNKQQNLLFSLQNQNSVKSHAFDQFNQTLDRIQERKSLKETQSISENTKNNFNQTGKTHKSRKNQQQQYQFSVQNPKDRKEQIIQEKGYTIMDGKIQMVLEPEQAEMALDILDKIQGYMQERKEAKKEELLNKKKRIDAMQMTYMDDDEFKKKKQVVRMEPYEAVLVKKFMSNVNHLTQDKYITNPYIDENIPWESKKKPKYAKIPQKATESDREELIRKLKKYKKIKRIKQEQEKAQPKLRKKDFDLCEFKSPNPNIVSKFCNQNFAEKTFFYEDKKRNPPAEASEQFESEIQYLQAYFELMHPGDYLLKCDFYKKGVKINKDRQIAKEDLIYFISQDKDFQQLYNIQDSDEIRDRLEKTKTNHIYYITFKEFVEFLYINKNIKRLQDEQYDQLTEELKAIQLLQKQENQELEEESEGYESDPEPAKKTLKSFKNTQNFNKTLNLTKELRSKSQGKLIKNDDKITEYPIKVTVPEVYSGADYFAKLYAENKKKRDQEEEEKIEKNIAKMKKAQKFTPKPIPAAVLDRNLWSQMQEQQEARRIQIRQDSIQNTLANEKPFSFYSKDPNPLKRRKLENMHKQDFLLSQMMQTKFKANKLAWTSAADYYKRLQEQELQKREERKASRAIIMQRTMANKQDYMSNQEKKLNDISKQFSFKPKPAKEIPDFEKLQEKFQTQLDNNKLSRPNCIQEPFNFREAKKSQKREYMDLENQLMKKMKEKPSVDKIEKARQATFTQPKIMPPSTQKQESLLQQKWKEREQKLEKQINKEIEAQKKEKKKQELKSQVQQILAQKVLEEKQVELKRKQECEEETRKFSQKSAVNRKELHEKTMSKPLIINSQPYKGAVYPYNKIYTNYKLLLKDKNHMKKMSSIPEWNQYYSQDEIQYKSIDFVKSLNLKILKQKQNRPYPWNILMDVNDLNEVAWLEGLEPRIVQNEQKIVQSKYISGYQ